MLCCVDSITEGGKLKVGYYQYLQVLKVEQMKPSERKLYLLWHAETCLQFIQVVKHQTGKLSGKFFCSLHLNVLGNFTVVV